ncbi:uncharacterized protein LOC143890502 isoform X2 [Tasmannia lanceolata]|uniref:uncharacterized protein LOC143890502 isoform X2 n=1 Tax=Tasmannia lanceolata TaxID=3420 RepID=UPI0040640271
MAAAEARAAWHRTVNRCVVQEDAKRAPKLPYSPSSSSWKVQSEASNGDSADRPGHPAASFMPLNWNPANSSLPPDTKWWLQLQSNFTHQKDFTCDQLNALETELEGMREGDVVSTAKLGEPLPTKENSCSSLDSQWRVSATCVKHDAEARMQELKAVNSNMQQPLKPKAEMAEFWYQEEGLMDWEPVDRLISNQPEKGCFDLETPWMGGDKMEPWWRIADKDELASLVAQKSLEHIENCDLPRPQSMHVRRGPFSCLESLPYDDIFSSSLDQKIHTGQSNPVDYARLSPASGSTDGKCWPSGGGHFLYDSEKLCSTNSYSTSIKNPTASSTVSENDPSKAQLLEALRHSQTRAREAEKAAQQAYTEKEHIVKLFLRQASQLFAYKQWLQLLQLENLCLQLKNNDHKISTLFPVLPWMPSKAKWLRKAGHKVRRTKWGQPKCDFSKYAVTFAVGLSLAGAGLLLGWTMAWLLPTF